jgi:hypothetical protein
MTRIHADTWGPDDLSRVLPVLLAVGAPAMDPHVFAQSAH